MLSTITAILSLCLARTALASVYVTNPVAATTATGGQVLNVTWADDGQSPTVAQIGPCSVDIYVGSVNVQTWLQNLAASVDVSKTSSISSTIHPDIGESGDYYFVRFTSLALKSQKNPQYPYQSFSAKFTINAMTGKFNSTVLAQIESTGSAASSAMPSAAAPSASKNVAVVSASKSAAPVTTSGAAGQSISTSTSLVLSFLGAATYFIM